MSAELISASLLACMRVPQRIISETQLGLYTAVIVCSSYRLYKAKMMICC